MGSIESGGTKENDIPKLATMETDEAQVLVRDLQRVSVVCVCCFFSFVLEGSVLVLVSVSLQNSMVIRSIPLSSIFNIMSSAIWLRWHRAILVRFMQPNSR